MLLLKVVKVPTVRELKSQGEEIDGFKMLKLN
jgi:hypothetical protein